MNHKEIAQAAARKLYNEMSSCLMLSDREFDAVEAKIAAIIQKEMAEHFCALEIEGLLAAGEELYDMVQCGTLWDTERRERACAAWAAVAGKEKNDADKG